MNDTASNSGLLAKLSDSGFALIVANLVPLIGVLFWSWSVSSILILYWFENVVIGIINVAKIITSSASEGAQQQKLFLVPFFIVHYFMFCTGHGVFVFSFFGDSDGYFSGSVSMSPLAVLGRAVEIFSTPLAFAAAVLALSHAYSFVRNYLFGGERERLSPRRLMSMPYSRIIVLHVTIIAGGFVTTMLAGPIWVIVILVLVKIAVDLRMHLAEHRRAAATDSISASRP